MRPFIPVLALGVLLACGLSCGARAEMKFYPDPVYQKLHAEDAHPMDEMIELAKQGDVRAQFILGDMYLKGKGGLARDEKESRRWFEESARHGYGYSFIRLAALAKKENQPREAWQWYTLAIDAFDSGSAQKYAIHARRELIASAKLDRDDMMEARKTMRVWEMERNKILRAENEAWRESQRLEREHAGLQHAVTSEQKNNPPSKQEREHEQD